MAAAEPSALSGNGSAVPLDVSLQALAAHYGCLADGLDALQSALREGDAAGIAESSKAVNGLTRQTSAIHDAVLPVTAPGTGGQPSLIAHVQSVIDATPNTLMRERLLSGAHRVAQQMQRVLELRARIGTLAHDLASANQEMLDVIRQLDGRGSTYDRTSAPRSNGRARTVLDTQA